MTTHFEKPSFHEGNVELRFIDGEVCIYACEEGMRNIISICQKLINSPKNGHIHLEDHVLLTENSLKGVIAVFDKK